MNWIIENKEWLFSGVGVIILGLVLNLFKRDKLPILNSFRKNDSKMDNISPSNNPRKFVINSINNVNETNKKLVTHQNKVDLQILFIDDEKFKTVDNLKSAGYINTKTIKDVTNLDCSDVKNANVIFVDINGVGEKLFPTDKGLGLAEALKRKYPQKYVVIYSAQEHGDRFHKALKIVDYTLSKNAEPYEFINVIENCMK
jgi:hypothetical protein